MMHLEETLESWQSKRGGPPASMTIEKRQGLIETFPETSTVSPMTLKRSSEVIANRDGPVRDLDHSTSSGAVKRFPANRNFDIEQKALRGFEIGCHPQSRCLRQGDESVRVGGDVSCVISQAERISARPGTRKSTALGARRTAAARR